mgnify:CR=1 FL=1
MPFTTQKINILVSTAGIFNVYQIFSFRPYSPHEDLTDKQFNQARDLLIEYATVFKDEYASVLANLYFFGLSGYLVANNKEALKWAEISAGDYGFPDLADPYGQYLYTANFIIAGIYLESGKKKEAQIIAKERNKKESVNYITSQFKKIDKFNDKILFDLANFLRNSKEYKKAINYYTEILNSPTHSVEIKSEIYYRRGSSYERIGNYEKADKDLIESLKINPDDAYVLNYLAYSWLERDYKIDEALEMLIKAYNMESDDPYIIDSIGWAYYLIKDYLKAERFLKRAVELMPDDPTVNDHYGDILWKLDRKIQARYFWKNVLEMKDLEEAMRKNIHKKMVNGLISS